MKCCIHEWVAATKFDSVFLTSNYIPSTVTRRELYNYLLASSTSIFIDLFKSDGSLLALALDGGFFPLARLLSRLRTARMREFSFALLTN